MDWLEATDERLTWHNVEELYPLEGGHRVQRVSERWRTQFSPTAARRALYSANVFLRFHSDTDIIAIRWHNTEPLPPPEEGHCGEVFCNGRKVGRFAIEERQESEFASEEGGLWEIHFPWAATVVFDGLGVGSGCTVQPERAGRKPRWLVHGDSITQGWTTYTATGTWVWLASQTLGLEPINMGFGSVGFGEPPIAHYLASRQDWGLLTLVFSYGDPTDATEVAHRIEAIEAFLGTVRQAQPDKPIQCVTPIVRLPWDVEVTDKAIVDKVRDYRQRMMDVVRRRMASDGNLRLVDGLSCVGDPQGLADGVHPNDEGMRWFARRIAEDWNEKLNAR